MVDSHGVIRPLLRVHSRASHEQGLLGLFRFHRKWHRRESTPSDLALQTDTMLSRFPWLRWVTALPPFLGKATGVAIFGNDNEECEDNMFSFRYPSGSNLTLTSGETVEAATAPTIESRTFSFIAGSRQRAHTVCSGIGR